MLNLRPARAFLEHACDGCVPAEVFRTALVPTFGLGLRLALCLTATAILVVLAGDGRENVQQHGVDRGEHAPREIVGANTELRPTRGEIKGDNPNLSRIDVRPQALPIVSR